IPRSGYYTLEEAWRQWATASDPHLTPDIFAPSLHSSTETFKKWLTAPPSKPFVIAADSREEGLAFLACLASSNGLRHFQDVAAIFTSLESLRTLVTSSIPFIPIVFSRDVERELADTYRRLHCIVLRPRNAVDIQPDVSLDLLGYSAFEHALSAMGIE